MRMNIRVLFLGVFMLSCMLVVQGQSRSALEKQKKDLQKQISKIDAAIASNKKKQSANTVQLQSLRQKVKIRQGIVNNINREIGGLDRDIEINRAEVSRLERELDTLRSSYARMCVNYYNNKSEGLRLMYILSSTSLSQAYARSQYIKEYTSAIRRRGEEVRVKSVETQSSIDRLEKLKGEKKVLLSEQKKEMTELSTDQKRIERIQASLKKNRKQLDRDMKNARNTAARIQKEINDIIRREIEAQNKKAGGSKKSSSGQLALTPEAKALSASFAQNKGKLPWPVERGVIFMHHGRQQYPGTTAYVDVPGVLIATTQGAMARAVFAGEVIRVQVKSDGLYMVFVQHGNYFTVYVDLLTVNVKKGDKVTTKQTIGRINTDKFENKTILNFSLYYNNQKQNPELWLAK
ncbi:MAG: peptidoglycan DD-metalloendopeptidase family protein [Flavobacteriales bacterium]|nr:peptidoglycan DD-metalloendopeptidase family protein [Flavobacteriales bacterium]